MTNKLWKSKKILKQRIVMKKRYFEKIKQVSGYLSFSRRGILVQAA